MPPRDFSVTAMRRRSKDGLNGAPSPCGAILRFSKKPKERAFN